MDSNAYFQLALYLAILLTLSVPLVWYIARVMEGKSKINRIFGGVERVLCRLCGINRDAEMDCIRFSTCNLGLCATRSLRQPLAQDNH